MFHNLLAMAFSPPDWVVRFLALHEIAAEYLLEHLPAFLLGQCVILLNATYLMIKNPPDELLAALQHRTSLKSARWKRLFREADVVLQSDEDHRVRLRASAFLLNAMWLIPDEFAAETRENALEAVRQVVLEQPPTALASGIRRQLAELQAVTPSTRS